MITLSRPDPDALAGRGVVVTGAARGIGRALARGFARDGAVVVGVDRDADGLAELEPDGVLAVAGDVTDPGALARAVERAIDRAGRLDVLVNNAGIMRAAPVDAVAPSELVQAHAVHVLGALHGIQAAAGPMRERGYGRIVSVISRAAELCRPGTAGYASAKAALWALSRVAAGELAEHGILVNCLIPGMTDTGIWPRPRPELQSPDAVYPTALALATLPDGGPTGRVFWDLAEYPMFERARRDGVAALSTGANGTAGGA